MNVKWSENDKNFIRDNAHAMKDVEIAAALTESTGRIVTLQAVRKMRQKLGVKKAPGRGICGLTTDKKNGE
ncbi:MAG: hypothetical protein V3R57_05720 [Candidatus Bathyarchaeia archaeon]